MISIKTFAIVICLMPGLAFAQTQRIRIYKSSHSMQFSAGPFDEGGCRLGLSQATDAEILDQTADRVLVRFPKAMNGCFLDQMRGRNLAEGWIPKNEITYASQEPETLQPIAAAGIQQAAEEPCPGETNLPEQNLLDIGELVQQIRAEDSGRKTQAEIDQYMACYPQSAAGQQNYESYKPIIETVSQVFQANLGLGDLMVDKTLYTCLLRRESGYDPKAQSITGAVGLGQHTSINIEHIGNRLNNPNSWERKLWDRFFEQMKTTEQGRRMLNECPQTANGKTPAFNNRGDAMCPLNSMAASAIYNLQVQQALRRSTATLNNEWEKQVTWEEEMNYQLAIGAAYNLGDGAASRAVDDLSLDGWLTSIRNRSPNPSKRTEVAGHIEALRNCMQKDNWKPMHPNDPPQCELPKPAPEIRIVPTPRPRPEDR